MIHTGSVAEVQDEEKQRLAKHGNLYEGFSICPVYAGMNRSSKIAVCLCNHLPRTYGDEAGSLKQVYDDRTSASYTRG